MFLRKIDQLLYWPNKDWMSTVKGIHFMLFNKFYFVIAKNTEGEPTVEEIE